MAVPQFEEIHVAGSPAPEDYFQRFNAGLREVELLGRLYGEAAKRQHSAGLAQLMRADLDAAYKYQEQLNLARRQLRPLPDRPVWQALEQVNALLQTEAVAAPPTIGMQQRIAMEQQLLPGEPLSAPTATAIHAQRQWARRMATLDRLMPLARAGVIQHPDIERQRYEEAQRAYAEAVARRQKAYQAYQASQEPGYADAAASAAAEEFLAADEAATRAVQTMALMAVDRPQDPTSIYPGRRGQWLIFLLLVALFVWLTLKAWRDGAMSVLIGAAAGLLFDFLSSRRRRT